MTKGALYIAISSMVFILSGYIINVWLGRLLGPVYYGDYGVIISLMTVINLIQTAGLPQAVSKYIAQDEEKSEAILRSGLYLQIVSTALITVVYFFLASPIAMILKDLTLVPYIRVSALIFPVYGIYSLYVGYFNGKHMFGKQALLNTVYSLSKLLAIIYLVNIFHLFGALIGFILAPLIALSAGFHIPGKDRQHYPYKKLIYFSLPLIGFAFFSTLFQSLDLLFLKSLVSSGTAPGFYTAAGNISRISLFGMSAFSAVLFPSISRSVGQNNHERTRSLISRALRFVLIILVPVSLLISALSRPIIELLYGKTYFPAASALSILAIGMGFITLFMIMGSILNGAGKPKISLLISIFAIFVVSLFCLILVPRMAIAGAALATSLGGLFALAAGAYFVFYYFRPSFALISIIRILAASFAVYFLAGSIYVPPSMLPLYFPALISLYCLLLFLLGEITKDDWKIFRSLLIWLSQS